MPNIERLLEFAREKKINYYDIDDLVMHEPVKKLFEQRMAEINSKLAPYETHQEIRAACHAISPSRGVN